MKGTLYPWTTFNTAGSFVNLFAKRFTLHHKGSFEDIFIGNIFFTKWYPLGYSCIYRTATGCKEEGGIIFYLTNSVALFVVVLMTAKEIASPPISILKGEGTLQKGLMIVAIINRIIWLFAVNVIKNLPGLHLSLTCSVIFS